ncbi:MAG: molybdopterin molybdenumtransferase MoeA [Clostridia bacterium]|nr:molybdopterin molybdenumtransferase MoeA [Clostridia bacterium]
MLNVVSVEKAREVIKSSFRITPESEYVTLEKAYGRVLSEDIISETDSPPFDRSTVDGYAVIAADTYGAGDSIPAILEIRSEIAMGENAGFALKRGECAAIPTGGMLPGNADAVVMSEYAEPDGIGSVLIYKPSAPLENVTKRGDDIAAGEKALSKNTITDERAAGVLAMLGISDVPVYKKPKVGIISTGNELFDIDETPAGAGVRDVNSYLLGALCYECGCEPVMYGIVPDDFDKLRNTVRKACGECAVVLLSGGSSAGERDLTMAVIDDLGITLIHGIAAKPGKPTVIGKVGDIAVFGLPGHPAAAFFVGQALVKPFLYSLTGRTCRPRYSEYTLALNVPSNHGREEYIPVRIENGEAMPVQAKSGIISVLSKADGYIIIDRNSEGLRAGEKVKVIDFHA